MNTAYMQQQISGAKYFSYLLHITQAGFAINHRLQSDIWLL